MSALAYLINPESVCLVSDTLALRADDKRPYLFVTKMFLVPHLHLVVCGTGLMNVITEWSRTVYEKVLAREIITLDEFTTEPLQELHASIAPNNDPTTIYHFGYSPEEGRCLGFAYRSTNDFESEELLSNALGIKPSENVEDKAKQVIEDCGIVGGMVELIKMAKEVDDAKPTRERVGVGGALCAAFITRDGMHTSEVYRFPDYEDIYSEMVLGLK